MQWSSRGIALVADENKRGTQSLRAVSNIRHDWIEYRFTAARLDAPLGGMQKNEDEALTMRWSMPTLVDIPLCMSKNIECKRSRIEPTR